MNILRKLVVPTILVTVLLSSCNKNEIALIIPYEEEKATKFLLDKGVKQSELDVIEEMMIPADA